MLITKNMKMADLIHEDYTLLPMINRFGIQLGYGEKTVAQICEKHQVNTDFFLEVINSFHDKNYFPEKKLRKFRLNCIVDYLKSAHDFYLKFKIPKIERLIDKLVEISEIDKRILLTVKNFFKEYVDQLNAHVKREEDEIYPYILEVEKAYFDKKPDNKFLQKLYEYSISEFEADHEDIESQLYDLKNILIKYIPMPKNNNLCNNILSELFKLEADIRDHSEMEERIMIPKVKEMEKAIKKNQKRE